MNDLKRNFITVFTATYNRAHLLPKLYESLCKQNNFSFEWLVVDDGSTDFTQKWMESLNTEKFKIKYFKQENSGKHIAINKGLKEASGEYFLLLDSDDWLRDNAIRTIIDDIIPQVKPKLAGFGFLRSNSKIQTYKLEVWEDYLLKSYNSFKGLEMQLCYKTHIFRQYPFPEIAGEKFCRESLVVKRIAKKYKTLFTTYMLTQGEYMEDGLSVNSWERVKSNPKYGMLLYSEMFHHPLTANEKMQYGKMYWDIALSANQVPFLKKVFKIPMDITIKVFWKKILKKLRN